MAKGFASTLVCIVVVLAPLPFGSAEPFWGATWSALLAIALLTNGSKTIDPRLQGSILCVLVVAVVWVAVVALQYAPAGSLLPAGPGWEDATRILGDRPVTPRLAAYGEVPIAATVAPLALLLAMLAGLVCGSDPAFTGKIYSWVAIAGLIYAGYGIFAEIANPNMLLWRQKTAYVGAVTSTFVNHNTAATFFGTVTVICFLRALRELRRRFDGTRCRDLEYVAKKLKRLEFSAIKYALAFIVVFATTLMTRSRAGSLLTMAVLCVVAALYFTREIKTGRHALIAAAVLVALGALVVEVTGGPLVSEIETRGVFDAGRAQAWQSALLIVRDHPWLGTGLGTFEGVFPAYRDPTGGVWGVWDHAHSTPIELFVEMGIPFGLLVTAMWTTMLVSLLVASSRSSGNRRLYVIAGAGIAILATLHSMVDFPLQIPGYSIFCCVLVGSSLAAALTASKRRAAQQFEPGQDNSPTLAVRNWPTIGKSR